MSAERRKASRWTKLSPKCVFCDILTEPAITLHIDGERIRGWRCPRCGFALIYPRDIPKMIYLLKETMKLKT